MFLYEAYPEPKCFHPVNVEPKEYHSIQNELFVEFRENGTWSFFRGQDRFFSLPAFLESRDYLLHYKHKLVLIAIVFFF